MSQSESFPNSPCTDQIHLAERELSAFIAAVVELFGAEKARLSVEDWLDELELMDVSPRSTRRDWRAITITASLRLANRLNVARHRQASVGTWTPDTQTAVSAASLMIAAVMEDRTSRGAGDEMNTYADDPSTLVETLDLKGAIHLGPFRWRR